MWGRSIAKLVQITPISLWFMVVITYNYTVATGAYKPTYKWGPHIVWFWLKRICTRYIRKLGQFIFTRYRWVENLHKSKIRPWKNSKESIPCTNWSVHALNNDSPWSCKTFHHSWGISFAVCVYNDSDVELNPQMVCVRSLRPASSNQVAWGSPVEWFSMILAAKPVVLLYTTELWPFTLYQL